MTQVCACLTSIVWFRGPKLFALVLLLLVGTVGSSLAQTTDDSDTQFWSDLQITVPVRAEVDLTLTGQLRVTEGVSRLADERAGIGINVKPWRFLHFGTAYTYVATQPRSGVSLHENRFGLSATLRFPAWKGFTISDRNLVERRLRQAGGNTTRYRNRLQVEYPLEIARTKLTVFASNEVFYDWRFAEWHRNRFAAGAGKNWTRWFGTDLYYMRQSDTRGRDLNVIGTVFKVKL